MLTVNVGQPFIPSEYNLAFDRIYPAIRKYKSDERIHSRVDHIEREFKRSFRQERPSTSAIQRKDVRYETLHCDSLHYPHLCRVGKLCKRVVQCAEALAKIMGGDQQLSWQRSQNDFVQISNLIDRGIVSVIVKKTETPRFSTFLCGPRQLANVKDEDFKTFPVLISISANDKTPEKTMKQIISTLGAKKENIIFTLNTKPTETLKDWVRFNLSKDDRGPQVIFQSRNEVLKAVSTIYGYSIETYLKSFLEMADVAENEMKKWTCGSYSKNKKPQERNAFQQIYERHLPTNKDSFEEEIYLLEKATQRDLKNLRSEARTALKSVMKSDIKGRITVPHNVADRLKTLRKDGVVGFGHFCGQFRIDVDNRLSEERIGSLKNQIQIIMKEHDKIPLIKRVKVNQRKCIQPGGKLYVNENDHNKFGTIGTFAKYGENKEHIAAFTCNHCVFQPLETFVKVDEESRPLRDVIYSSQATDFAAIKVPDDVTEHIDMQIRNKDNQPLQSSLFQDREEDLSDSQVFKRGAKTGTTEGRVRCGDYRFLSDEGKRISVLVAGLDETPFVMRGDSGSIVYRMDQNDPNDRKIELLSICQGGEIESRDEDDNIEEKLSMTYRLDSPVQTMSEELKTSIEFQ